jgi:hypothetical protein
MNVHTQAIHELDWKAGLLVFSGRENPAWGITPSEAQHIIDIPATTTQSQLGYRGTFLSNSNGEIWLASRHAVVLSGAKGRETRSDPEQRFERAILALAPEEIPIPDLDI